MDHKRKNHVQPVEAQSNFRSDHAKVKRHRTGILFFIHAQSAEKIKRTVINCLLVQRIQMK